MGVGLRQNCANKSTKAVADDMHYSLSVRPESRAPRESVFFVLCRTTNGVARESIDAYSMRRGCAAAAAAGARCARATRQRVNYLDAACGTRLSVAINRSETRRRSGTAARPSYGAMQLARPVRKPPPAISTKAGLSDRILINTERRSRSE